MSGKAWMRGRMGFSNPCGPFRPWKPGYSCDMSAFKEAVSLLFIACSKRLRTAVSFFTVAIVVCVLLFGMFCARITPERRSRTDSRMRWGVIVFFPKLHWQQGAEIV